MEDDVPEGRDRSARFEAFRRKCERISHYLKTRKYPCGLTEGQKKVTRRQAKNFSYDEERDELFYAVHRATGRVQARKRVILSENEALDIIQYCHSGLATAGHIGINNTLSKISSRYTWHGMKQDVVEFIQSCDRCQKSQSHRLKSQAPQLRSVSAGEPLELVRMEIIGPLPTTKEGYKYVLTFTDYHSKFVDFFALLSKEASGVASIIQRFVYRWGAPKRLLSDLSREFAVKINRELCSKLGITRTISSGYHRQANGLDEHQTLKDCLSKLVSEKQENWSSYLDEVAFTLRIQKLASTEYSPFYLMFGRHPRTPFEMESAEHEVNLSVSEMTKTDIEETVSQREGRMASICSIVKQNPAKAQDTEK